MKGRVVTAAAPVSRVACSVPGIGVGRWSGIGEFNGERFTNYANGTFTLPEFDSAAAGFEAARGSIRSYYRDYNNSMVGDQWAPTISSDYFTTIGTVCGGPELRYDSRARI